MGNLRLGRGACERDRDRSFRDTQEYLEEEHGEAEARSAGLVRGDQPELDEALDPEFEPAFEVDADPELENRDIHEADEELEAEGPEEDVRSVGGPFAPRSERTIRGMGGKVYDYRGTGLCPPNGGRIRPLFMVHHIPVVKNVRGTGVFMKLGNILRGKGLGIQAATDAEGNVALYKRFDEFCYGHRGANQLACKGRPVVTDEDMQVLTAKCDAWGQEVCGTEAAARGEATPVTTGAPSPQPAIPLPPGPEATPLPYPSSVA